MNRKYKSYLDFLGKLKKCKNLGETINLIINFSKKHEPNWISAKTPPKKNGAYLGFLADKEQIEILVWYNGCWLWGNIISVDNVTHWMPLPKSPRKEVIK